MLLSGTTLSVHTANSKIVPVPPRRLVMYAGSTGPVNPLTQLIETALRADPAADEAVETVRRCYVGYRRTVVEASILRTTARPPDEASQAIFAGQMEKMPR